MLLCDLDLQGHPRSIFQLKEHKSINNELQPKACEAGVTNTRIQKLHADMIQVYKIVHRIDKINTDMFFELSETTRTGGHKYKIKKQKNQDKF